MIKAINVEIEGKDPGILMHKYPMVPIEAFDKKSCEEQAEISAHRDQETRALYIPGVAIQRALVNGATYSKGKGRASLKKETAACLMVTPSQVDLEWDGNKITEYKIDSRAVVMPATKGRVVRHRPLIEHWRAKFTLEYDDALLSADQVRRIVDDMGQRVGLLDYRPEKMGPFGRCSVVHWEPIKIEG